MIDLDFPSALDNLRKIELNNFIEIADQLFNFSQTNIIDFSKEEDAPYLRLPIFHLDDEVKHLKLTKLLRFKGSELNNDLNPFSNYEPDKWYYLIKGNDAKNSEWGDNIEQLRLGDAYQLTKYLITYMDRIRHNVIDVLQRNYTKLTVAERQFILNVLDIEMLEHNQLHILYDIVKGTNPKWNENKFTQVKSLLVKELIKGLE